MTPGKSTREQVIDKFGAPTKEFSKGGKLSDGLSFQEEEAISGTVESNFFFNRKGILFRMDVYPARKVTRAQAIRVYGKGFSERTTSKGVRVIQYAKKGLSIFFEKDTDQVRVFMFTKAVSSKDTTWSK